MKGFYQIPATGLMQSASSRTSAYIVAVLLMTSHTLRDGERQTHFLPLTLVPETRPQMKLVQIQSVFWSLSDKRPICPWDFFYIRGTNGIIYTQATILLPVHLVEVSVLKTQFTAVRGRLIQEHELTLHEQTSALQPLLTKSTQVRRRMSVPCYHT